MRTQKYNVKEDKYSIKLTFTNEGKVYLIADTSFDANIEDLENLIKDLTEIKNNLNKTQNEQN